MAIRTKRQARQEREGRAALRTWLRLLACTNLIEGRIRSRLRERFATTLPRFDVLAQLDAAARELKRGLTMSELSQRLMVTNGNLTGLVEHLVSQGYVTRAVSPSDRRTQIVQLAPSGRRMFNRMIPEHRAWVEQMLAGLDHHEHIQLYKLLGLLKDSFHRLEEAEERRR